jgi:hypothetical protein
VARIVRFDLRIATDGRSGSALCFGSGVGQSRTHLTADSSSRSERLMFRYGGSRSRNSTSVPKTAKRGRALVLGSGRVRNDRSEPRMEGSVTLSADFVSGVKARLRPGWIAPQGAIDSSPGRQPWGSAGLTPTSPVRGGTRHLTDSVAPDGAWLRACHWFPGLTSWAIILRPSGTDGRTLNAYEHGRDPRPHAPSKTRRCRHGPGSKRMCMGGVDGAGRLATLANSR